ncbi:MAG: DUF2934 domain-containing protein [Candidatus Nitrotoga sp.]
MKHHEASHKQSATPKNEIGDGLDREEMISVAAYYHAEHRGFVDDDSLADWLSAEAEIDAMHKNRKDIKIKDHAN